MNGPVPASAPQIASTPSSRVAAELPATPNLAAAHNSMGSGRHNIAAEATAWVGGANNATTQAAIRQSVSSAPSIQAGNVECLAGGAQPVGDVHHQRHHREDGETVGERAHHGGEPEVAVDVGGHE